MTTKSMRKTPTLEKIDLEHGTAASVVANAVTEKQFLEQVVAFAKLNHWLCYHTWIAIHSPAGFPDLVMCKPPRLIFAELKKERGKLSEVQQEWLAALCGVPKVETYVWRPSDWEEIERALRGDE